MPFRLDEISPENELQQNLEQLNIVDNDGYECDVDDNLREHEEEGLTSNDQEQDRKPTSDNDNKDNDNKDNEKKENDETTCRSEDVSNEIETSNITNDNENDKDATSSVDESDFSLPKHRKDCPSDDERTDSESLSNEEEEDEEEEELGSEEGNYHLNSSQIIPPPSKVPYEQVTPSKPSNAHLQVNGVNVPFEISPMSLGDNSPQDDLDVARIINPIMRSISDLKSDFRTQLAKLNYYSDSSLDEVKIDENWQHVEFEKSQDQHCYDAIVTAVKLLDVIMPLQLPEEAKERLAQARHILVEKALLCRISSSTENINISSSSNPQAADLAIVDSTPDNSVGSSAELVSKNNNKSSEENGSAQGSNSKPQDKVVDGSTTANNESSNSTTYRKYQRDPTQGRKLRRHSTRGASAYSSPKGGRRNQNYSPRTSNARSPRGSTVTSSIAGSNNSVLQANNRRFVGFLPSRCFTCGGIGHFATNCPNKGSYISANTSKNQHLSRRKRPDTNRYRRTTESVGNNSTSNE